MEKLEDKPFPERDFTMYRMNRNNGFIGFGEDMLIEV